jgi:hypothetical protein
MNADDELSSNPLDEPWTIGRRTKWVIAVLVVLFVVRVATAGEDESPPRRDERTGRVETSTSLADHSALSATTVVPPAGTASDDLPAEYLEEYSEILDEEWETLITEELELSCGSFGGGSVAELRTSSDLSAPVDGSYTAWAERYGFQTLGGLPAETWAVMPEGYTQRCS